MGRATMGMRVGHDKEWGTTMRGKPNEKAQETLFNIFWAFSLGLPLVIVPPSSLCPTLVPVIAPPLSCRPSPGHHPVVIFPLSFPCHSPGHPPILILLSLLSAAPHPPPHQPPVIHPASRGPQQCVAVAGPVSSSCHHLKKFISKNK